MEGHRFNFCWKNSQLFSKSYVTEEWSPTQCVSTQRERKLFATIYFHISRPNLFIRKINFLALLNTQDRDSDLLEGQTVIPSLNCSGRFQDPYL